MFRSDKYLVQNANDLGIDPENVNASSVNLCVSGHIIEWKKCDPELDFAIDFNIQHGYHPDHDIPLDLMGIQWYKKEHNLKLDEKFILYPGRFYLCSTIEKVRIPQGKVALLSLRSTPGRLGLRHALSWHFDLGFEGQGTLEFSTMLPFELTIGEPLVQLLYADCEEAMLPYDRIGRYHNQRGTTLAKKIKKVKK